MQSRSSTAIPPPPPVRGSGLAATLVDATRVVRVGRQSRSVLDRVTLHLPSGEFVGVVGASGSGKSTLVRVIAGLDPLTAGEVRFNGVPLPPLLLRTDQRVAYLPQDVVVHESLTPAAVLGYAARLRGLGDPAHGPIDLVRTALDRVGLADRSGVPIVRLSGGQRKRVALAVELLGDPGLLLLDEATSGLDPATEAEMMGLFRSLADEGRTVVCVTHTPDRLQMCDRVVVMADGKCVYHGPPAELPGFFGVHSLEDIYVALAGQRAGVWRKQFISTHPDRATTPPEVPFPAQHDPPSPPTPVPTQAAILTARYARLQWADPRAMVMQLAQAPAIGLMIGATFGDIRSRFAEQHAADSRQVLFVLAIAVLWCAGAASAREVVKELPVVRHEARFGLDLRAYLLSKFILLGGLALTQTVILLAIVRSLVHLPGPVDFQMLILGMTALAGVGLGLMISAASGTSERAMTLLPVTLIGLAVFSGGLARLAGPALWAARIGSPAYWALDGLKAPLGSGLRTATYPGAPGEYQPPILGPGGPFALDIVALLAQAALMLTMAYVALRGRLKA